MTMTSVHSKLKTLAPSEGDTHSLLTHTIVWKATANDTNGQYAMFEMFDTHGGSAPVHSHPWEETFYILEGEIEIQIGNRREILSTGSMSHIPANAFHAFKVTTESARVLVIVSPAVAEDFYRELGTKITSLPPEPSLFQEICAKYDLRLQS